MSPLAFSLDNFLRAFLNPLPEVQALPAVPPPKAENNWLHQREDHGGSGTKETYDTISLKNTRQGKLSHYPNSKVCKGELATVLWKAGVRSGFGSLLL